MGVEELFDEDFVAFREAVEFDHFGVVEVGEGVVFVEDVGGAAAHAGTEVFARGAEDEDGAAGHVFAAVVADAFDNSGGARVAHGKAFAGAAVDVEASACGTVEDGVAADAIFFGAELGTGRGDEGDLAAAHAFADVVVGFAGELDVYALHEEGAEALACGAVEFESEGAVGQAGVAVAVGDFAGEFGADAAVDVFDVVTEGEFAASAQGGFGILEDDVVERAVFVPVVALPGVVAGEVGVEFVDGEEAGEVDGVDAAVACAALAQEVGATNEFIHGAHSEAGHDFAHFLGDGVEVVDDHFGAAFEFGAEAVVLGGDADGTGVEVALAHIDAAQGDEGGGAEVVFFGAKEGGDHDVGAGAHAAVGAQGDAVAQAVEHEDLLCLGDADFPGGASVFDGGEGAGTGAAFVAGDEDDVGVGFGDACSDGADACLGDKFDADFGAGVDLFEVVDELGEVFDGVDVVVWRGGDEHDARDAAAEAGDEGGDFVAGELAAFAGFGALGHFDFDFFGGGEVFGGDAEASRGDLFDGRVGGVAVFHGLEAGGVFAAFAGVGFAADAVHGDGEGFVSFGGEGAEGHAGGGEAAADGFNAFDFVEGDGDGVHEFEEVSDGKGGGGEDGFDVFFIVFDAVGFVLAFEADEGVEVLDDGGGDGVELAAFAVAEVAGVGECGFGGVGKFVACEGVFGDVLVADAADLAGGACEAFVDDVFAYADGFKDLGTAVAGDGGDAHFGEDFEEAFFEGFDVVGCGLGEGEVFDLAFFDHFLDGFEGEPGVNAARAVADEAGDLVDVACFGGLADEGAAHAFASAHKVVMHGGAGQKHRERSGVFVHAAVAEDEDGFALIYGKFGVFAKLAQRGVECFGP